ncbi:hypothetical protein [Vibrio kanaloae]|uniref:hypothetical protein n=1 Tax=Vibrio kanaloae TaxID=170673 RepID=UPI0010BD6CA5|nr:hypothetical protein [Vibrio kanaloae]TKE96159.1 hypothetical protein FCV46_21330 [Vibrio kanaloae]TKF53690.1 hypothetical protein FCV51_20600 [Vibrio kanaloae]
MMSKRIVAISIAAIALAWLSYWYNFSYLHSYKISTDPGDWGVLGDFLGGVLNPILTFFTIVLLVSSLSLQRESNDHLKSEIEKSEHFEKVRAFESRFFNMIDSQKVLFESFKLSFLNNGVVDVKYSSAAVGELEDLILQLKRANASVAQIKGAIESFDDNDEIYSVTRTFCIIVKTIDAKISEENGFTLIDKKEFYETLINFTDYSLFKLVLICIKYLDQDNLKVLAKNDFRDVLSSVGADSYLSNI